MSNEPKYRWLWSIIATVVLIGAMLSLAIPSWRRGGFTVLLIGFAIVSYYFQASLWYPDPEQPPPIWYVAVSVIGRVIIVVAIALVLWFSP